MKEQTAKKLAGVIDIDQPFIAVHPGSGGSARDWPIQKFAELLDRIQNSEFRIQKIKVAVTLGPGEEQLKEKLRAYLKSEPKWVSGLSLPELAAFLSQAQLLVANSTGPLHIATAVKTKVIGLYCPMIPCHPKRWGPYGPGHSSLIPPVELCRKCIDQRCQEYDCMDKIAVKEVYARVEESINSKF